MNKQLELFSEPKIPKELEEILMRKDCALAINISGGKDSLAMLNWVSSQHRQRNWQSNIFAIHADLGRIEWPQTKSIVVSQANKAGVPLVVVKREKGDLIDRWKQRYETIKKEGNTKPFWSSPSARYCTSDMKVAPIDKYLRKFPLSISCLGLRSEESSNRAKKPKLAYRKSIVSKKFKDIPIGSALNSFDGKARLAINWLPIHDWNLDEVWNGCGTSTEEWLRRKKLDDKEAVKGWPAHPAYVIGKGNNRLSCSFCIMGDKNDLTNAIHYNKETFMELLKLEKESGWSFQKNRSLTSLQNTD